MSENTKWGDKCKQPFKPWPLFQTQTDKKIGDTIAQIADQTAGWPESQKNLQQHVLPTLMAWQSRLRSEMEAISSAKSISIKLLKRQTRRVKFLKWVLYWHPRLVTLRCQILILKLRVAWSIHGKSILIAALVLMIGVAVMFLWME